MSQAQAEREHSEAGVARRALPPGLTDPEVAWPVVHVDAGGLSLRRPGRSAQRRLDEALRQAVEIVHPGAVSGQTLLKVHIGEPKCRTRMRPHYVAVTAEFARDHGASHVAAGDTTVAYTGARGHKQNPRGRPRQYLELARRHGWLPSGPAGVPFVVLDRPASSRLAQFPFAEVEVRRRLKGVERFHDFYLAGGFDAADVVINHAHLTLHGLAGVAACVKSVAMGCSSLAGKLRMHQSLFPRFDPELCVLCGRCVESCPEDALSIPPGAECPVVDKLKCIGCGECVSVCAVTRGAVVLEGEAIEDWKRGEASLAERMADYTVGLMQGKWDSTIHVCHLYSVTPLCDCVDVAQKPMLSNDLGFLLGKNPFAVDRLAGELLAQGLEQEPVEQQSVEETALNSAAAMAAYARETYGIVPEAPVERLAVTSPVQQGRRS
ncbi:MAG: DUF362 domain-containing protein [Planctomycetota bacterium]